MYSLIVVDYNSLDKTTDYILLCRRYIENKDASHAVIVENGTLKKTIELLTERFREPKSSKLAKRMGAVGSRVFFCRELEVIHKYGETTKKRVRIFCDRNRF